jgi:hypothetical protein
MKRNPANKAWVINRAIKAAVALSQEVSLAVSSRRRWRRQPLP